ncbi:SDR family NAD(P)-dependent oxidoreductase [Sphaerochaeta sp.]|jgi:3-oxoacyl-[acyl-carrier protein] reductase|uniref:SDR family NAD(P)-dependent oxidoreductase n=1 Tax=Sphaerochaeta sp. TaxID=1972642 RepID=UPI002FCBDFD5
MRLKGKTVVITGGNKGIGKAIAYRFASEGARIAFLARRPIVEILADMHSRGFDAIAIQTRITSYVSVEKAIKSIIEQWGTIDILVNNAASFSREPMLEMTLEAWHQVLDINLNAAFYCSKAILPYLVKNKNGVILNISSVTAKCGDNEAAPIYTTSKGALTTLTKSLARQLAPYNIRVNAVAPHAIVTQMGSEWTEDKRKQVVSSIPLGRMGEPEEVASSALFLVSDEASFITGETINVNGGYLMD